MFLYLHVGKLFVSKFLIKVSLSGINKKIMEDIIISIKPIIQIILLKRKRFI